MKKHLTGGFLATLMLALLGLLLLSFFACSPAVVPQAPVAIPATQELSVIQRDTLLVTTERTVTDTLFLGAEYFTVIDTVPCPPGLTRDSMVIVTNTVVKPGQKIPYSVVVHDTVRTVEFKPVTAAQIMGSGYSWGERFAWLALVITLVAGWLKPGKNKPSSNPPTA